MNMYFKQDERIGEFLWSYSTVRCVMSFGGWSSLGFGDKLRKSEARTSRRDPSLVHAQVPVVGSGCDYRKFGDDFPSLKNNTTRTLAVYQDTVKGGTLGGSSHVNSFPFNAPFSYCGV